MTTPKRASAKSSGRRRTSATSTTTGSRTARSRSTGRRRTTRSRSTTRRRTTPRVATTVGSALGLLLVTALTSMTWPQRLALAGAVLVAGLAYVLWRNRAEILAAADGSAAPPADLAPPTDIAPPPDPAPPTVTPQT